MDKEHKKKPMSMEDFKKDSFFRIVGLGSSGIKNGSVNHDKYLYKNWKKEKNDR